MKTTKIEKFTDDLGRRKVFWLIDGDWVHKGWLRPTTPRTGFTWHRRSV